MKDMCYEIKKKLFEWGRVGIVKDMCYEIKKKAVRVGEGGDSEGHVLRDTTSRDLCGLFYSPQY